MFVTLWEYEVKRGSEELFERQYGPEGEWVRLFRRDAGYRGTRLLREVGAERVYVTMDMWETRAAYKNFREKWEPEYAEIDRNCQVMTSAERQVGEFES